jgi:hypothetical protein
MIEKTIELLKSLDFYNANDSIQFAKGAYKYPSTVKENFNHYKRWVYIIFNNKK